MTKKWPDESGNYTQWRLTAVILPGTLYAPHGKVKLYSGKQAYPAGS
jgi:hypothetical protein